MREIMLISAGFLVLAVAGADAGPSVSWGYGITRVPPSSARIEPAAPGSECEAVVTFHNGPDDPVALNEAPLTLGDLTVYVTQDVNFGQWLADEVSVRVPEGYHARPPRMMLDETKDGQFLICKGEANLA